MTGHDVSAGRPMITGMLYHASYRRCRKSKRRCLAYSKHICIHQRNGSRQATLKVMLYGKEFLPSFSATGDFPDSPVLTYYEGIARRAAIPSRLIPHGALLSRSARWQLSRFATDFSGGEVEKHAILTVHASIGRRAPIGGHHQKNWEPTDHAQMPGHALVRSRPRERQVSFWACVAVRREKLDLEVAYLS